MTYRQKSFVQPAEYFVYVTVSEYPSCGFKGTFTSRVGTASDLKEAKDLIKKDKINMGDTLGGLIPAVSTKGRTYRIFKSLGWEEVKV